MKKIQSKIKALECLQYFLNAAVCGQIVPNFELVRDIIVVRVTCMKIQSNMKELECLQHSTLIFQTPNDSLLIPENTRT